VHGQVKSAGKFSFVRIYESGHEVPFYQPLVSLEMVNRTIHGLDIATGDTVVTDSYVTEGPFSSDFVNGNSTVIFADIPKNATYNTTTNQPNPPYDAASTIGGDSGSRLMTRHERTVLDAQKVKKRNADVPWHFGKRVTTKKGRAVLFEDSVASKRKHSHGHAFRSEL